MKLDVKELTKISLKEERSERWPRYKKAFINAFVKLYAEKKRRGLKSVDHWKNGEEMFEWWLSNQSSREDPDQTVMFE